MNRKKGMRSGFWVYHRVCVRTPRCDGRGSTAVLTIVLLPRNARWKNIGLKSIICSVPSGTAQYILKGMEWWDKKVSLFIFDCGNSGLAEQQGSGQKSLKQGWSYWIRGLVTNQMVCRAQLELTLLSLLSTSCRVITVNRPRNNSILPQKGGIFRQESEPKWWSRMRRES